MMASEYKKRGGEYNTDKKDQDASQKNLSKWGEEDWQTKEGSGEAKQDDGSRKRYLPKKAWERMTEEEKQATDEKKLEESKEGKQFVGNTEEAKEARKETNEEEAEQYEGKGGDENAAEGQEDEDEEYVDDDGDEDEDGKDNDAEENGNEEDEEENDKENASTGQKRGRGKQSNGSNKKQKADNSDDKQNGTVGSKHDSAEAPAPAGSADRLPKKGQEVQWKSLPGWVKGDVVEVVHEEKEVEGKMVKGKENDPRIVLKSKNGKIAVHKPDAVHFED